MNAVRSEVEELKEKIVKLEETISNQVRKIYICLKKIETVHDKF